MMLSVSFTPGPATAPTVNNMDLRLGDPGDLVLIEPMVSVNGTDSGNVAISSGNGLRLSNNGGATASATITFPVLSGASSGGDTDTTFDAQGRLFWTNLEHINGDLDVTVAQINPSTGASVGTTSNVTPQGNLSDDKAFLVADTSANSPHRNDLYIVWTKFDSSGSGCGTRVLFSRSQDQAATWSAPLEVSNGKGADNTCGTADDEGYVWPSDVAVASNGDIYVAYHSQPDNTTDIHTTSGTVGQTFVLRSMDGGVTFPQKALAFGAGASDISVNLHDTQAARNQAFAGAQFWTQGSFQPFLLADPARAGNVYVITTDDPDNVHGSGDDADVVFALSTDNGLHWGTSTIASGPINSNSFQLFPTAAIDRFGTIVVAWYDNRAGLKNANGHFLLDVYATYSVDGGLTWAPQFMVNDATNHFDPDAGALQRFPTPFAPCDATQSNQTCRIGEYFGIDVFAGTAYVAWNCNTFNTANPPQPVGQQICFDTFPINGTVTVSGDDGGVARDDTITLNSVTNNPGFMEVRVNGVRQYSGLAGNISVNGLAGNDTITDLSSFPATLIGGTGNDSITGGSGNDVLIGGPGIDTLDGGPGFDTASYALAAGPVTSNLAAAAQPKTTNDGDGGQDTLIGVENLLGSDFGDLLAGDAAANTISGGNGDDTLIGRGGDDSLDGGPGSDTASYSSAASAVTLDLSSAPPQTSADGDGGRDTLTSIENVIGSAFNDRLTGDNRANILDGLNGSDTLVGGDGDDTLLGRRGNDSLDGGLGNDTAS